MGIPSQSGRRSRARWIVRGAFKFWVLRVFKSTPLVVGGNSISLPVRGVATRSFVLGTFPGLYRGNVN